MKFLIYLLKFGNYRFFWTTLDRYRINMLISGSFMPSIIVGAVACPICMPEFYTPNTKPKQVSNVYSIHVMNVMNVTRTVKNMENLI
jgi:hypothetical protein